MYVSVRRAPAAEESGVESDGVRSRPDVRSRAPIYALGLTSFFTDISSEMVAAILPLYLTVRIGFGIEEFGAFDGLFAASSVLLLLAGGILSDRTRRPKPVAVSGYSLSMLSRIGLLMSWSPIGFLIADRVGKGLRAAPRDTLISLHADPNNLGTAFSIHRSLDTAGAMIGPFIAFAVLRILPSDYQTVFLLSLLAGVIGVATIVLGVPSARVDTEKPVPKGRGGGGPSGPAESSTTESSTTESATAESGPAGLRLRDIPQGGRVKRVAVAAGLLGAAKASDGLLYLVLLKQADFDANYFPLLFVGTSLVYMLLAIPMGMLADRIGKTRILLAAQPLFAGVYLLLMTFGAPGTPVIFACLALLGAYYAMTDGLFPAVASELTTIATRGRGIAVVGFGTAGGRLIAGIGFGLIWATLGVESALGLFLGGLVLATVAATVVMSPLLSTSLSPTSGQGASRA